MSGVREGGCLCGAVRYRLKGPLRHFVACHCGQCRKTHGHYPAYTALPSASLALVMADGLRWYRSSDAAERGFCGTCGASLFWRRIGDELVSVAAGTLDDTEGLALAEHIFVSDKAGYYQLDDDLPKHAAGLASPLMEP
jgi:hypothetical protein